MRQLHDSSFRNLSDMIGETVTIFTESGGGSGQGFTGIVIGCNECFVRLVTSFGSAPSHVFGKDRNVFDCNCRSCRNDNNRNHCSFCGNNDHNRNNNHFEVGSVINIPIDKIVAFVHNAV